MNRTVQPIYETRISNVQHKQVGASEFRIHTWFDHQRNTFVIDVLAADEPAAERSLSAAAGASTR